MKHLSAENQSGFLLMFFDSVFKSPYPFAFSLPVLCQEQYFIYQSIVDHNSAVPLFVKIFGWFAWYEHPDLKS